MHRAHAVLISTASVVRLVQCSVPCRAAARCAWCTSHSCSRTALRSSMHCVHCDGYERGPRSICVVSLSVEQKPKTKKHTRTSFACAWLPRLRRCTTLLPWPHVPVATVLPCPVPTTWQILTQRSFAAGTPTQLCCKKELQPTNNAHTQVQFAHSHGACRYARPCQAFRLPAQRFPSDLRRIPLLLCCVCVDACLCKRKKQQNAKRNYSWEE